MMLQKYKVQPSNSVDETRVDKYKAHTPLQNFLSHSLFFFHKLHSFFGGSKSSGSLLVHFGTRSLTKKTHGTERKAQVVSCLNIKSVFFFFFLSWSFSHLQALLAWQEIYLIIKIKTVVLAKTLFI